MFDLMNKEVALNDNIIYLGAIGGKVYPEYGQVKEIKDGKICFLPTGKNRKKWLTNKAIVIKVENALL